MHKSPLIFQKFQLERPTSKGERLNANYIRSYPLPKTFLYLQTAFVAALRRVRIAALFWGTLKNNHHLLFSLTHAVIFTEHLLYTGAVMKTCQYSR